MILNKGTQVFLKALSDNGHIMSVSSVCAKNLYQTYGLFETYVLPHFVIPVARNPCHTL